MGFVKVGIAEIEVMKILRTSKSLEPVGGTLANLMEKGLIYCEKGEWKLTRKGRRIIILFL